MKPPTMTPAQKSELEATRKALNANYRKLQLIAESMEMYRHPGYAFLYMLIKKYEKLKRKTRNVGKG